MRLPQNPPDAHDIIRERSSDMETLGQSEYTEFARLCEQKYWHWDRIRRVARHQGVSPELAWVLVKLTRRQRYRKLALTGKNGERLKYVVPDQIQHELMMIDRELAGRLESADESPLTSTQRERFIISAFREEAIASSMLEGAATTRQEAKQMLRTGRKPKNVGEQMVFNNYRAIMFIRENRKMPLTSEFLLELHEILTRDTLKNERDVGRFREDSDDITVVDPRDNEVLHYPPPAPELESRIAELCNFANAKAKDHGFIHPVLKACILHFQLGYDHPFCDGNGRTARAIFYWYMLRCGYWLFEYLPISRLIYKAPAQYVRAYLYAEHDEFDVTYFLKYNLKIIGRAREDLRQHIAKKQIEIGRAKKIFTTDGRLNHRQREVILQAARNPDRFFTISSHQSLHGVAYDTARNDLLELANWGYMTHRRIGRRYEFVASPKLIEAEPVGEV